MEYNNKLHPRYPTAPWSLCLGIIFYSYTKLILTGRVVDVVPFPKWGFWSYKTETHNPKQAESPDMPTSYWTKAFLITQRSTGCACTNVVLAKWHIFRLSEQNCRTTAINNHASQSLDFFLFPFLKGRGIKRLMCAKCLNDLYSRVAMRQKNERVKAANEWLSFCTVTRE